MHHSDDELVKRFNERMEKHSQEEKLGATGKYPDGKIQPNDAGEIKFSVGHDPDNALCFLDFGTQVKWLAMTPQDAIDLGRALIKHGRKALRLKAKTH